jgi:hypothetical protein
VVLAFELWNPAKGYVDHFEGNPADIIRGPHLLGVTREIEIRRPGTWIGALFEYSPPRCGFSSAEQGLLTAALRGEGATDRELSIVLRISPHTIKRMWPSIYRRVAASLPNVLPASLRHDGDAAERGKEKRRHLLAYLRGHPEELRPSSRKLLMRRPNTSLVLRDCSAS